MQSYDFPSPEKMFETSTSSTSDTSQFISRSKSMSHLLPENYTPREILRIRERLLRTNSRLERSQLWNFTAKQKLTLLLLALVDFISFCSMSIMAPFFPKEAEEKGLSSMMIGFIFSFHALVVFLTSPIFGKLLPKFGTKTVFLTGMVIAGICNLLFGMLEYVSNYTLFTTFSILIRGFEALGASAFSTASFVFIVNAFPQNIGAVLGILETFVGLGMSAGPALGGVLYTLGGFSLPFYVLGTVIIFFIPLNIFLLPVVEEFNVTNRPPSICQLIKVPTVIVTSLVVIVVSSIWAFLDPTLEPHLRQFNLTPEKVGLIFLLLSALYGASSPAWGWLSDKVNNHWSMMIIGLFMCSIGLLLLGPSPFLPFLDTVLWLDLVALSILGISVALALLPTFQRLLDSVVNNGCGDTLSTYSLVAGLWSSFYSLGEVIGPSIGGLLLQCYGFPLAATIMAIITFTLALVAFFFFLFKTTSCNQLDNSSDSGISESWSASNLNSRETSPLLLRTVSTMYTEEKRNDQHRQSC